MFCPNCGRKNSDDARFCINCGYRFDDTDIYGGDAREPYYEDLYSEPVMPEKSRSGGKKAIIAIVVIVLAVVLAAIAALGYRLMGDQKWQSDYDQGTKYYSMKEYDLAADAFSDAINDDGDRMEAYVSRGDSYMGIAEQFMQTHYPGADIGSIAGVASAADIKVLYGYYQKACDDYAKYKELGGVAADERRIRAEACMDSLLKKEQQTQESEQEVQKPESAEPEKKPSGTDSTYILSGSSSSYLSESDLRGLSAEELALARNEIYARHGRMFDKKKYQNYFNTKSWYTPTVKPADFKDSMLNKYEKANVDLIKNYEKKLSSGSNSGTAQTEQKQTGDSTYIFSGSSSSYLSESDLYGLSSWDLAIARNEIYARHGRMFENQKYQNYFNTKSWYVPTIKASDFKDSMLNAYEKANVKLISDYEKKQG